MSSPQYASCMQACSACAIACEVCASACLKEDDVQMMATCIQLDRECADICRLAEILMARESGLVDEFCRLCAIICQACGEECAKHEKDHCQQCAQACQHCVEECESISLA